MNEALQANKLNPAVRTRVIVTGQPGIGKSLGVYYLLFHCLAQGLPVFFRNDDGVTYFSKYGVQQASAALPNVLHVDDVAPVLQGAIALVDAEAKSWDPMEASWLDRCCCVFWAISPNPKRTQDWKKQVRAKNWYMDVWSPDEIAAETYKRGLDAATVKKHLDVVGPIARTLFDNDQDSILEDAHQDLREALESLAKGWSVSDIWQMATRSPTETFTNRIVCLGPHENNRSVSKAYFLSKKVLQAVFEHVQTSTESLQRFQAVVMSSGPKTRSSVGPMFELLVHSQLEEGGSPAADFVMACDLPPIAAPLHIRTFSGGPFRFDVKGEDFNMPFPRYFRPSSAKFAAIDAIYFHSSSSVVLLQMTVGQAHSFKAPHLSQIINQLRLAGHMNESTRISHCLIGIKVSDVRSSMAVASIELHKWKSRTQQENAVAVEQVRQSAVLRKADDDLVKSIKVCGVVYHPLRQTFEKVFERG